MSADKSDSNNEDQNIYTKNLPQYSSGMTPSIIKTINNTSPTPPTDSMYTYNGDVLAANKSRRPNEPYESYIEDSFVGHWEREDDDDDSHDEYHTNQGGEKSHEAEDDDSALHPSTIEFDFDSFGPESFIYTPSTTKATNNNNSSNVNMNGNTHPEDKAEGILAATEKITIEQAEAEQPERKTPSPTPTSVITTGEFESQSNTITNQPLIDITEADIASNPRIYSPSSEEYLVDAPQIDMRVIEPYKKVISHAGYCHLHDPSAPPPNPGEPVPAIIVFSACYLPDRSRRDYDYVMDHLFLYVLYSLHELIADDYILIYLHNTQPSTASTSRKSTTSESSSPTSTNDTQSQNNLPTFTWMKRCYQMIDRKLRKNLKILYLVKPTFWLKTIVIMCKPFISAKFSKKLRFVEDMNGLKKCIPVDELTMPASARNI